MLWIHDKFYTFYDHFLEQIAERKILVEWVEETILEPDDMHYSQSTGRYMYDKFIEAANRTVRAVVDEDELMIVTAHYLDNKPTEGEIMQIKYDAKTDMMYIRLNDAPFHRNHVVNDAMVVDLAEDGMIIGIELISPSRYVDNVDEITYRYSAKNAPTTVTGTIET